jgi:hypothetical protein
MLFKKEFLKDLAHDDYDKNEVEVIYTDLIDSNRWSLVYEQIFLFNDKYYRTVYQVGATEQQDERPYEYDLEEIECEEVVPKEITKIIYLPIDK